jgi:hypothetical protein
MKSNSSDLIALRDMVRNLPLIRARVEDQQTARIYTEYLSKLMAAIDSTVRIHELSSAWEGIGDEDSETEEALVTLKVARAYRNSVVFQGGNWDLYLACQDPWSFIPQQSGWGETL